MKLNKYNLLYILGAVALFFAYAWFPIVTHGTWNAPDEVAAVYFSEHIPLFGGDYELEATYADELGGLVHPRSSVVVNGMLTPSMWLGLPWLLKLVTSITGLDPSLAQLIIPLLAVLAIAAWHEIVFAYTQDRKLAVFTVIALAVHPGWWYFTARGLHPNIMFVSMLIFAIYFWYVLANKRITKRPDLWREAMLLLGGLSVGMAIFARTNELVWLLPVLLFVLWAKRKLPVRELAVSAIGLLIPIAIMFQLNSAIYGSGLINGYNVVVDPVPVAVAIERVELESLPLGLNLIFPFGIHEANILQNFWDFHFAFFVFWSFFALYGLGLLGLRWRTFDYKKVRGFKTLMLIGALISIYLVVLYGSWNLNDNPDPNAITLGTSYIRYWLPITIMMTPFIGYALDTGFSRKRSYKYQIASQAIWILAFLMIGLRLTMYGHDEGLAYIAANLEGYDEERSAILDQTSEGDLIIVDRSDKILFPYRDVVVPLRDETTYAALPLMLDTVEKNRAELYYYGLTLPEEDVAHLEAVRLAPFELVIENIDQIGDKTLYKISR